MVCVAFYFCNGIVKRKTLIVYKLILLGLVDVFKYIFI